MVYFSRATPNLPTVIPAMDHIDTVFTDACQRTSKFGPAVRATIQIAKKTLNRYYSLTDAKTRRTQIYFSHTKTEVL